jgi:phosphoribosylaminoimidazole-succinocarboxamide synthase
MISDATIKRQLSHVIEETHFDFLGDRYVGKVRDNYVRGDYRVLITTDRLSCFDRVVTTVPFKGQVLNALALYWFERAKHLVSSHVVASPHPNVLIGRQAEVLPVEVVVREYLTGSAWRDYCAGKEVSGVRLPPGLRASERLTCPIVTPSTKAAKGTHDEPISEKAIISQGIVEPQLWEQMREVALTLFKYARDEVATRGLILVDTKYEFGIVSGELVLVDEIHTLDSSRYWKADSYLERFEAGESPVMLDKEPTRRWLFEQGFKGDGPIPHFSDEHRCAIARHYVDAYQLVSGQPFEAEGGDVTQALEAALRSWVLRHGRE